MRTTDQILAEVRTQKTCSRPMLYIYFKRLGISPLGARQRPQLYPDDTAQKILTNLGIMPERPSGKNGIVQLSTLRAERSKAATNGQARRGK